LDPYAPFLIALFVLGGLVIFEVVGALLGFSSLAEPADADGDAEGSPIDWLNRGRVPLSVLLMLLAGLFSAAGFAIQAVASALAAPLPVLPAAAIAAGIAVTATGEASRIVGKLLPREESYVAHADDLIGRTGVVTLGPLGGEHVGRVRVSDAQGNVHFPLVRPLSLEESIPEGEEATLVSRQGRVFFVVRKDQIADTSREIPLDGAPRAE
jgi:membrane protein implicated in regulation of membrane protease activity